MPRRRPGKPGPPRGTPTRSTPPRRSRPEGPIPKETPLTPFQRRRATPDGPAGPVGRACLAGLRAGLRIAAGLSTIAIAAAVLLYFRLMQGPLPLPQVAEIAARMVNATVDGSEIAIGGAALTLGGLGAPAGLEFLDVRVTAPDGTPLLAAPRLAARFRLADLAVGRLMPTAMVLIGAEARVVRSADGRIRFGLGAGAGVTMAAPARDGGAAGMAAVAGIIDGFVGDTPPVPTLARLQQVGILDARLIYEDAISGKRWRTAGSDLRIVRTAEGARAEMRAAVVERGTGTTRLVVGATRRAGTGVTAFRVGFEALRADDLAEQAAALAWVRLVDAPLWGELRFSVHPGGAIGPMTGRIAVPRAQVPGLGGSEGELGRARLDFTTDHGLGAVAIERLEIDGPRIAARLRGRLEAEGGDPLTAPRFAASLEIERLALDMPELFPGPVAFGSGQLLARLRLDPREIDIGHLHLSRGALTLAAAGRLREAPEGWAAALRATAQGARVADLKDLWPKGAGEGARRWVVENLDAGEIPDLVAQLWTGPGLTAPVLALDFSYRALSGRYLGAMPPIEAAAGTGHLTLGRFDLMLAEGRVDTAAGRLALGPSRFSVPDLEAEVPTADVAIAASGPIAGVLALIDAEPLGLVRRLGLDLGPVAGAAEVSAELAFPLLAALDVEDVAVSTEAALTAVGLVLPIGDGAPLRVSAARLDLAADTRALRVAGRAEADGVPVSVEWRERYGAGDAGRSLALAGVATPALLAARGIALAAFRDGQAPVRLTLEGRAEWMTLAAEIDLGPAGLAIPAIRWAKPAGEAGHLSVAARLGPAPEIDRFRLEAGALAASGSATLDADGALVEARLERLALADRAELAGRVRRAADGALDLRLSGPWLDLSAFLTDPPDGETAAGMPVRLSAEIGALTLTPRFRVVPASAVLVQTGEGAVTLELSGRAAGAPGAPGGDAAFDARYARRSGEPGTLRLAAPDAGALFAATGLFEGGRGGKLELDARMKPEPGIDIRGEARIRDMTVRRAATFGSILAEGGVTEAARAVQDGGLAFDSIDIPFTYSDGVIGFADAIARSSLLAVKVDGSVAEAADRVDLRGVISPAYALTGLLDEIPILGAILSGGRGEGILAMTFEVGGTLDSPEFSVNPLSLLTPGFLRGIFSGRSRRPSDAFMDRLGAEN